MSDDKPVPTEGKLAKQEASEDGEGVKRGPLAWALGWIGLPALVLGGIFGAGALVGANFHESWLTRAVVWVGNFFS